MRLIFIYSFTYFSFFCNSSCKTDCIQYGNSIDKEYFVHGKAGYGVNDYFTYEYYLVITNYKNREMKVLNFVEIANKFLDTLRSDRPVESIIFLGQSSNGCIPKVSQDLEKFEKYALITLRFEGGNPNNNGYIKKINSINFWQGGKEKTEISLNNPTEKESILNTIVDLSK